MSAGEPIAPAVIEHVAGVIGRHQVQVKKVALLASCVGLVVMMAGVALWPLVIVGIALAIGFRALAASASGQAWHARVIRKHADDPEVTWHYDGRQITGIVGGRADPALRLRVPRLFAGPLRYVPEARALPSTTSTPPATER